MLPFSRFRVDPKDIGFKPRGDLTTDAGIKALAGGLPDGPGQVTKAETPMIIQVARLFGVSRFRQFHEVFSMRGDVQKVCGPEYDASHLCALENAHICGNVG